MGHSYEESKKLVVKGLWLLAIITLIEVGVSLLGKGHIIPGLEDNNIVYGLCGLVIIILSLYKAYFIIYEFMHMAYEAKGLARSVIMPAGLLIWAVIAFFQEGSAWKANREYVQDRNMEGIETTLEQPAKKSDTKHMGDH